MIMATKPRHDKAKRPRSSAEVRRLREYLAQSLLPGDPVLDEANLADAAEFVLEAAQRRPDGHASILVRSALGDRRITRIAAINRDMPFLVDSLAATLAAQGLAVDALLHPIVPVRRSADGHFEALPAAAKADDLLESMIYLETERVEARQRRALERELAITLADVHAGVEDWPRLRQRMRDDAEQLQDTEGADLLRWFADGMLTLLGHLTRTRDGATSQRLGICRKSARELLSEDSYERAFAWFGKRGNKDRGPLIIKSNQISRVHRRVPLDLFIVPVIEAGRVTALSVHAGIWTSAALSAPPAKVPLLRRQLAAIGQRLGIQDGGHDAKALVHTLTALPHDLVIGFEDADIERVTTTMMALADSPRPRLAIVTAPLERHLFAFVWLPRDMLSNEMQDRIQQVLEAATQAETLDWSLLIEGGNLAMLRYVLDLRGAAPQPDERALDAELQDLLRGWPDAVEAALAQSEEPARAAALAGRYAEAFPAYYRTAYGPAEAALDIGRLRRLLPDDAERPLRRDARLYADPRDDEAELRLKIYQAGGSMALSDAVPALEHFGFRVLAERATELADSDLGMIHDFRLALPPGAERESLLGRAEAIEQAVAAVINGGAENDPFNRLVPVTDLSAQEADWLRAFYRYLRQASVAFTIPTVVDALRSAPGVTHALIDLFRARHDPAFTGDREAATAEADAAIGAALVAVTAINDDRLLRHYWALIGAVLRTNAFAPAGAEALALKFDSARVPNLPRPVPWREVFVYSRRVEGIHLRAGPVARGGIRWSDRRDDFRTEVLGLMKAQRVKNAVIVPTGAKGGYYPKRLPDQNLPGGREAWAAEGKASYQVFIRALLSITDNILDGKVIHPPGVVVHDGNDPYFVVAADKGTARFSDTANALAAERDFWLGDAFASGGSKGYDHKAMGITARGAWISVQRHFLEMGIDVQEERITVAGCGDMSGDVFGNGMLQSRAIALVAAFDHRHVFLDPAPDPEASWAERQRMFDLPSSSWADYSPELISEGGGVYARSLKRIPLSPQVRAVLGVEEEELDPETLINAILRSPVDLLWFGGIGTYIKASHESRADVGDPANDALRADGRDLRAKVVGEGANLGVTQGGRIEFALRGGRINADFIDNSAGVDCSDNEVNMKIALAAAMREGKLSEKRRVALLESMTDEVAALVLEDNRLQALALSMAEAQGARAVASQTRLIETLEAMGELDRRTEGLAEGDVLSRRAIDGKGLTRPELAVLLSSAKLALQRAIEASDLAADPAAEPLLLSDFPPSMQQPFRRQILDHQLRREIVATVVANRMVNRMGLIHPFELAEEEGVALDQVAAAFVGVCELLDLDTIWTAIDQGAMPERARLALFDRTAQGLRGHMADLLRAGGALPAPSALVGAVSASVAELIDHVDELLAAEARARAEAIAAELVAAGAPKALAFKVANLFAIDGSIGLAQLSRDTGLGSVALTHAFIDLGQRIGLDWAQSMAVAMDPSDPWERLLVAGLARDFQQMRLEFLRRAASGKGKGGGKVEGDLGAQVAEWAARNAAGIDQFRTLVGRAQGAIPLTPATLAQIASQARNLLQR
jgi:glutamate dehydrogenase